MSDLEETYRKRKEAYSAARKVYQECLETWDKERQKVIDAAVRVAQAEAEKEFNIKYGTDIENTKKLLEDANKELALLRCPKENLHSKPTDRYYHCNLCGFVWDDTSPAHF